METETDRQAVERVYRLVELNTEQIRALDRDKTVVILPDGILEEHGPYLPCFTDHYECDQLTDKLVAAITNRPGWSVLMFPTIPLGAGGANNIGGKPSFPGSYTVRATTLRAVFMDLATELGEQGFRWILVMSLHGAPDHNRALHQACAYFNDVYGGRMAHLLGLLDLSTIDDLFHAAPGLTADDHELAGIDIHAGTAETSWMLFARPDLVSPAHAHATPHTGKTWDELIHIAGAADWPGYFGAPARAKASYGEYYTAVFGARVQESAFKVLDGQDLDTAAVGDRAPLEDGAVAQRQQKEWLEKNGLA